MPHAPVKRRERERGSFLVAALFMVLVLAGLSFGFLQTSLADRKDIKYRETSAQALAAAETGLILAELEILAMKDSGDDGIGQVSGSIVTGTYEVTAVQNAEYPDRWELRARGESGQSVRGIAVGLRRRQSGFWVEGLYAKDTLTLNGTLSSDSYDSSLGSYASQAVNTDGNLTWAGKKGHVGSNKNVELIGTSALVRGNAIPGAGHVATFSGDPQVWGDTVPRKKNVDLPPTPIEDFEAALATNAAPAGLRVRLDADKDGVLDAPTVPTSLKTIGYDANKLSLSPKAQDYIVLQGGPDIDHPATYFFTDLNLGGGATIEIAGFVRVYVTGELNLGGGGVLNPSGEATRALFFAEPYEIPTGFNPDTSQRNTITVLGGDQAALAVYAPNRDVVVGGNGDLFGSVVGNKITIHGEGYFHYDEALAAIEGGSRPMTERLYWREISLPPR